MSDTQAITLTHDILVEIMRMLANVNQKRTMAALSATCKHLNYEGSRMMLSGTVIVYGRRRATSFFNFMLSNRATRLPLLRRLVIDISKVTEDTYELFDDTLRCAVNLSYRLVVDPFSHQSPTLRIALCSLMCDFQNALAHTVAS